MNKITGLTTRAALVVFLAASSFAAAPLRAAPPEPAAVVGHFDEALLTAMRQATSLGYQGRYASLQSVINDTFDIPAMTRIAVGPRWSGMSEDQQHRLIEAFRNFIVATFASRFDDYGGERFEVQGAKPIAYGVLIENQLVKPNGEVVRINYLVHQTADGWRAVDVYLDGTISELAVRRSEFTAVLARSGPEGLIAALVQKTQKLAGGGLAPLAEARSLITE
jgi:phospholipid transport system substrate-binding protein